MYLLKKLIKRRTDRDRRRSQKFKLPDVWGMISHVRASFSKDWMGNAAKSVTLWASRQNSLLMHWLIVAYALCTTLADHPDTQSIVQTTRLCPRSEATVKVAAPWQTAYCVNWKPPFFSACTQICHIAEPWRMTRSCDLHMLLERLGASFSLLKKEKEVWYYDSHLQEMQYKPCG